MMWRGALSAADRARGGWGGLVRWVLVACLVTAGRASGGQDERRLGAALRERASCFDRVRVEFDWVEAQAPKKADPFDPSNWYVDAPAPLVRKCSIWLARPAFRFWRSSPVPGEDESVQTWIDGKRTSFRLERDGRWSVYIDDNRWAIHGVIPYLTPFEMQVCDVQMSLLEMLEAGGLEIERWTDDEVVLAGYPTAQPHECDWKVRAVLDPRAGFLPLELRADIDFKNRKHIYWTVRTLDSVPVGDIRIMSEAIFALDTSPLPKRWQIYHYRLTDVVRDDSLDKEKLGIRVPRENLDYNDTTRGYSYSTDARGRIIREKQLTPEEMAERERALAEARRQQMLALQQREKRRHSFSAIVYGSVAVVVAVAGLWLWRYRARR